MRDDGERTAGDAGPQGQRRGQGGCNGRTAPARTPSPHNCGGGVPHYPWWSDLELDHCGTAGDKADGSELDGTGVQISATAAPAVGCGGGGSPRAAGCGQLGCPRPSFLVGKVRTTGLRPTPAGGRASGLAGGSACRLAFAQDTPLPSPPPCTLTPREASRQPVPGSWAFRVWPLLLLPHPRPRRSRNPFRLNKSLPDVNHSLPHRLPSNRCFFLTVEEFVRIFNDDH